MAVPVTLGFGFLASFLATVIGKLVEWLVKYFSKRAAIVIACIGVYLGLVGGVALLIQGILGGLNVALPGDLAQGIAMIAPSNFAACVSAIYSTKVALWIFDQKTKLLDWKVLS